MVVPGDSEACVAEEEPTAEDDDAGPGVDCDGLTRGAESRRDTEAPTAAASPLGRLDFGADRASVCCFCLNSACVHIEHQRLSAHCTMWMDLSCAEKRHSTQSFKGLT